MRKKKMNSSDRLDRQKKVRETWIKKKFIALLEDSKMVDN